MIDIAEAWKRLIDNKFIKQDLLLLKHEYIEFLIMEGISISWDEAHRYVNLMFDWENTLLL